MLEIGRCCPAPKRSVSADDVVHRPVSITSILSRVFEKNVAGKLSYYLESNSMLPLSQFSYRRGLKTRDALLT